MSRSRMLLLLVLLVVVAVARAGMAQGPGSPSGDQQVVTLSRAGCAGCPRYTVTVSGSGRVEFTYQGLRPHPWAHGTLHMGDVVSATADSQQVAALFRQIDRQGFFEIAENWMMQGPNCHSAIPDGSSIGVSVTMGGRQHTVNQYSGCRDAPAALGEIEASIDKVADVRQWLDSHP